MKRGRTFGPLGSPRIWRDDRWSCKNKSVFNPKIITKVYGKLRNALDWHLENLNEKPHPNLSDVGKSGKHLCCSCYWCILQFMREDLGWLMLFIYLFGGVGAVLWYVLSSKARKWTRMCSFHSPSMFIPLHSWLMTEVGKEDASSPHRSVTTAGCFSLTAPSQQPRSMG